MIGGITIDDGAVTASDTITKRRICCSKVPLIS
jgi:hypothetical protein